MKLQTSSYRKAILASLLVILLGIWCGIGGGLAPRASHASTLGGPLYTWGGNDAEQLGNGINNLENFNPGLANLPVGVTPTVIETSGAAEYSMAIGSDGKLYAWGYGGEGELGNGSVADSYIPAVVNLPVGGIPTKLAAGESHTMAILTPPTVTINNIAQAEGNSGTTNFTFTVTLSYTTNSTVSVNYTTANGTATAPSDYTASIGTIFFAPGTTTQTITIPVVGDTTAEANETFTVNLNMSGFNWATLANSQGTGAILNDDGNQ